MSIDADAGGDHEIAGAGVAVNIGVGDAAKSDAAKRGTQAGLRGTSYVERNAKIVCECIGGADGQDRQRSVRIGEDLDDVVDGAVASTGENRVTAGRDGAAGVLRSVGEGVLGE